jgi:hypothetical protein
MCQPVPAAARHGQRLLVAFLDDPAGFGADQSSVAGARPSTPADDSWPAAGSNDTGPTPVRFPNGDHLPGDVAGVLRVVLRAGGDVAVGTFPGGAPAQRPSDAATEIGGGVTVPVGPGCLAGDAERLPPGDDLDLASGSVPGKHAGQGVTGFVAGGPFPSLGDGMMIHSVKMRRPPSLGR